MEQQKVTKSIFGKDIDEKCPGDGFWTKLLVFLGILSNKEEGERWGQVDEEIDSRCRASKDALSE